MLAKLHYGYDRSLEIAVPDDRLVAQLGQATAAPIDVRTALTAALAHPLDFPPLNQAVVPGDKVAIALERGISQADILVAVLVDALISAGILVEDISVVLGPDPRNLTTTDDGDVAETDDLEPSSVSWTTAHGEVRYETHDPSNQRQLAYLAADAKAKPIYINRTIDEADFVIPVSQARAIDEFGYAGANTLIYPTFSDSRRNRRLRNPQLLHSAAHRQKLNAAANQVSWLVGLTFAVQIVPGEGQDVLQLFAGRADAVHQHAQQRFREAWSLPSCGVADIVVAAVGGTGDSTDWNQLGHALATALKLIEPNGTIVLLTDLATQPNLGVNSLVDCEDLDAACGQFAKDRPADALVATVLAQSLQNGRLFMLSQLAADLLEDLGIASLENGREVERLIAQHQRCILLDNAQFAFCESVSLR